MKKAVRILVTSVCGQETVYNQDRTGAHRAAGSSNKANLANKLVHNGHITPCHCVFVFSFLYILLFNKLRTTTTTEYALTYTIFFISR